MLSRVDRILLVVADRAAAQQTWQTCFGAESVREYDSVALGARSTVVQAGDTEFEFLEPTADGPARDFQENRGQGLFGAGFSTSDLGALQKQLEGEGVTAAEDGDRLFLDASQTVGMPTVISQQQPREKVGQINYAYEVTNVVPDWKAAEERYVRIFGLEQSRFCPIKSSAYGYEGTLTLFNPPERLDRVEITQTTADGAMNNFYQRRGASLYMCFIDVDDVMALADRLQGANARFVHSETDRAPEAGLFIHPLSLHGMLMGVSLHQYAWVWSGHKDLAGPLAAGRQVH